MKFYQVDAFTDTPFGGNPAGVVPLLPQPDGSPSLDELPEDIMQKIAREINCSETAFIMKSDDPLADVKVRFFTPTEEVDLCGHATIASFWLLAEKGYIQLKDGITITTQKTKCGVLPVAIYSQGGLLEKVMMVQTEPELTQSDLDVKALAKVLGTSPEALSIPGKPRIKPEIVSTGLPDLIVPVKDRKSLNDIQPDMAALARYCRDLGVISVHAFTFDTVNPESTVHCRDFAPSVGIPEESATGTASGALGAYLVSYAFVPIKKEKVTIVCEQGYAMNRPSTINVEIDIIEEKSPHDEGMNIVSGPPPCPHVEDMGHEVHHYRLGKVKVGGKAVTVVEGEINV
jgi:trans-2,3-dihydro-3-hydroxyanthranilate isomerase